MTNTFYNTDNVLIAAQTAMDYMTKQDPNVFLSSVWDRNGKYCTFVFKRHPKDNFGFWHVDIDPDTPDNILRVDGGMAATLPVLEHCATCILSLE